MRTGSSKNEPTLPDATVAGDHDRHRLAGPEQRALGVAQLDAEQAMHPRAGTSVVEPDGAVAGDGQLEVEQPAQPFRSPEQHSQTAAVPASAALGTSSWRMQALVRPSETVTSGGIAARHSSSTSGQRDAR
jgi:hypothetical protein